ncbi:CocE/NonD family hydrolase [Pseudofrankia sp. DC12]|uniref:CocE/NonD family hydrolase n=1 Tax=Pseudofrankia sp. DC12 TaxID=683315 RepID=UPI0005F79FC4|nr:CocE/NonD family hydrolase [Pseudofrankia sp. DC12]
MLAVGVTAVALVVTACGSSSVGSPPAASPASPLVARAQPLSATTTAWWSYTRPPTFGSTTTAVTVAMRDGTPLDCSLVRPATGGAAAGGRFPGLVVEFTPYDGLRTTYIQEAAYFAARGYDGLVCNLRGTGKSGGTWEHAMSPQDGLDASDLVEWLAAQPFSDGRIGMYGESYGGFTTYRAAIDQAPHLLAVAPLQSTASLYDDVIYPGGIKTTEGGSVDNWPGLVQPLSGGRVDAAAEYAANRAHPTFDSYWQERSFAGQYGSIKVPVLAMGGWVDQYFRSGALANIEGARSRTWAIYGQWPHQSPIAFPNCPGLCNPQGLAPGVLLAWFDHWVKQLPGTPIPAKPTFVSYEGPNSGAAGWREITTVDPAHAAKSALTLNADGSLGATAGTSTAGNVVFHQPADPTKPGGSVTFQTAPLAKAMSMFGHPTLTLRASLSGPDANLYAELLDVAPDGTSTLVNDGFLRASHRTSNVTPTPVPVGKLTTFTIAIRADDWRFAAGHRIAVRLSGGAASMLTSNTTPVDVTVATGAGGSILDLPDLTGP